jgi:hypothetical protein
VNARVGGTASHTLHATPLTTAKPTYARCVMISRSRLVCSAVRLKWTLEMGWR